jgi:hypothetical protein
MLLLGVFLLPPAAALSTGAFSRNCPKGRRKGEADSLSGFAREGKPRTLEAMQDSIANEAARWQRAMDRPSADPS